MTATLYEDVTALTTVPKIVQGVVASWDPMLAMTAYQKSVMALITYGECDGDLLRYCKGDRLRERDCAARGQSCIYEGDDVGYNCGDCQRCGGSECVDIESDSFTVGHAAIAVLCPMPMLRVMARCEFVGCVNGF